MTKERLKAIEEEIWLSGGEYERYIEVKAAIAALREARAFAREIFNGLGMPEEWTEADYYAALERHPWLKEAEK